MLRIKELSLNRWALNFSFRTAKKGDTFYLSCSDNCFSEGNLVFSHDKGCSLSHETGPGKFSFIIMKNQYNLMDEKGRKTSRKRSIRLPVQGPFHSIEKRKFAYSSGGLTQIVIIYPQGMPFDVEFLPNMHLLRRDIDLSYGEYKAAVFIVEGSGSYTLKRDGIEERFELQNSDDIGSRGSGIIYQIFPDRFNRLAGESGEFRKFGSRPGRADYYGGNLKGILEKLDYLKGLSIEYLYLNPLFSSHSNHRYDVDDYFAIDRMLGSEEDLALLVEKCHSLGIKVILDMVFNHSSVYFAPFQDVLQKGDRSRYIDWYIFHEKKYEVFHSRYDARKGGKKPSYETFMGVGLMPKLNHGNPEVVDFFKNVVQFYLKRFNVDGFRYDVGHSIPKSSISAIRQHTEKMKSGLVHIGEAWCLGSDLVSEDYYDSLTNYHIRKAIISYVNGTQNIMDFYSHYLEEVVAYGQSLDKMMNILDSHDTVRLLTTLHYDIGKFKLAYLILMILNGRPTIYYGDEVALAGNNDPDCRRTFPWENVGSDVNKFFLDITRLRATEECFRQGLLFTKQLDGEDLIIKYGSKNSMILCIYKTHEKGRNKQISLFEIENILLEEPDFCLFKIDSKSLLEYGI